MSVAGQQALWGGQPEDVGEGETSTDSYCTPPEVMEPVRAAAGGRVILDPWTNTYAIAHGWVNAMHAWTIASGRHPDRMIDPRPWPLEPDDFTFGNPPYSEPLPYVTRFIFEVIRARAWGMLLLKSDNRTAWAEALLDLRHPIILWRGAISFYHRGNRVTGNNFASTLYVVDGTDVTPKARAAMLERVFEGKGWVYG